MSTILLMNLIDVGIMPLAHPNPLPQGERGFRPTEITKNEIKKIIN
jgi:hypothetical protein